jgi:hypothetical protein
VTFLGTKRGGNRRRTLTAARPWSEDASAHVPPLNNGRKARYFATRSDNRPVESFTSDLSSGGVKLHYFAGAFALAVKVGFINNVQFTAPFISCGVIQLEL